MFKQDFADQNTQAPRISASRYNAIIGACLLWGFLVNWLLVVNISTETLISIGVWYFLGGYFVSCLVGTLLFNYSKNPVVSFIGYTLVVIPFGLILNLALSNYDQDLVLDAIQITGGVTLVMLLLGTMYPAFFERIAPVLGTVLLIVVAIEIVQVFVLNIHQSWIDWAVAVIFCGYIGFNWANANQIPKTVDNAVDSAAALYIDIINLFIRVLSLLWQSHHTM